MTTRVKDLDGARYVQVEAREGLVFMWGRGFSYVFDKGVVMNAMRKEFGVVPLESEPAVEPVVA